MSYYEQATQGNLQVFFFLMYSSYTLLKIMHFIIIFPIVFFLNRGAAQFIVLCSSYSET